MHTAHPWRIHELTPDFRLEDVWALPTPGGSDDFPVLVETLAAGASSERADGATRALWAIRLKLGRLFGWDGDGSSAPTLRDRLPPDLRDGPVGPRVAGLLFTPLYMTSDEFAAELVNRTMQGVLHLGWVPEGDAYRGQMAILVKPNGLLGHAYMAAIKPARHLIVYPQMLNRLARAWRAARPRARVTVRWAVLYDGDCGFCKWLLAGLLRWDRGGRLAPIALQRPEAGDLLADLPPGERMASWHLIAPNGERQSRGAALPALLRLLPGGRLPAAVFARAPRLTDRGYRWIADHRSQLSKLVPSSAKRRAAARVREREQVR